MSFSSATFVHNMRMPLAATGSRQLATCNWLTATFVRCPIGSLITARERHIKRAKEREGSEVGAVLLCFGDFLTRRRPQEIKGGRRGRGRGEAGLHWMHVNDLIALA